MLEEIPQGIADEVLDSVNGLLAVERLGIAVYSEMEHRLEFTSSPHISATPEIVRQCFDCQSYLSDKDIRALPLLVDIGGEHQCVGVLYLERQEESMQEAGRLLFQLIFKYVDIMVSNAVIRLATKHHDIKVAHEEARRVSWGDSVLHVQNMVLGNCLSTTRHETIYYPNKIKQVIGRLSVQSLSEGEEKESVETISGLMEYYKGIFTISNSYVSRRLEEAAFRRTIIPVADIIAYAGKYFKKAGKGGANKVTMAIGLPEARVIEDISQLHFLMENLIDGALSFHQDGELILKAIVDGEYIHFLFTDRRREKHVEELNLLFHPNLTRMTSGEKGELRRTGCLIYKQIIRDHDEFAGRHGYRINAESARGGGFAVHFIVLKR